jgi:hypothetical protein
MAEATVTKSTEWASRPESSASATRYSILESREARAIISALSSVATTPQKYLARCVAARPLPVAQSQATSREVTVVDEKANKHDVTDLTLHGGGRGFESPRLHC